MYSREYGGRTLRFEASGGLINSSLVMQDKETDSYWSIMKGQAVGGRFKGTSLKELPVTHKVRWKDWVMLHPGTLVLSVDGREDEEGNAYASYFDSSDGFRGTQASDDRLETKQEVFVFRWAGKAFAVPFSSVEGGKTFGIGDVHVFLFREEGSPIHASTLAFVSHRGTFSKVDENWVHSTSGSPFDRETRSFGEDADGVEPLTGFDTYWYTWSPFHPETEILE